MNQLIKVYLVGGAVRDKLLGRAVIDTDYVVVGATPEYMLQQGFTQVGADFPVFLHPHTKQEYALARTERKSGNAHTDFVVHASSDVTLQEDLIRRDLTINAMAIEVKSLFDSSETTGEVIDFYGGLDDLQQGTLRHVSLAFCEDPLRVLRVARFYARYYNVYYQNPSHTFTIADETLTLIKKMVAGGELSHLSSERIWTESHRATMSDNPHIYWQTLADIGALTLFRPLDKVWNKSLTTQTISQALQLSAQFDLTIEQRWAIVMAMFANDDNYLQAIQQIDKANCIPKKVSNFSKLYAQYANDFTKINQTDQPTASDLLTLLQGIKGHKEPQQITALLLIDTVLNMARSQVLLQLSLDSYQTVAINDIDPNLKGKAIGEALQAKRIEHLQKLLHNGQAHNG